MRRIIFLLCFMSLTIIGYAQGHEPGNNLGKSLSSMKQQFPELRFLKSDEKGDGIKMEDVPMDDLKEGYRLAQ